MAQPSATLVASVRRFLADHPPFSRMSQADLDHLVARLELAYFADGERIVSPDDGVPDACWIIRQGIVEGMRAAHGGGRGVASAEPLAVSEAPLQLGAGDIFPAGALLARRAVSSTYRAHGDVFCWRLPRTAFDELAQRSEVFLDFCRRRLAALLDLSREALQASSAVRVAQSRAMDQPLAEVMRRSPLSCGPGEPLRAVFERMEARAVGSIVVVGDTPASEPTAASSPPVSGIFTRQDVVGRVVLAGMSLDTPVGAVMSTPVRCLRDTDSVADAMLLMAEKGIRHVPVIDAGGTLAGIVTERDLFVLQRRGLRQIADTIRGARGGGALRQAAQDIREWSFALVAQGVSPAFITRLISRLNDQLTARLLGLVGEAHGIDPRAYCWLALGSEGREEQTIATDQDNAMILAPDGKVSRDAMLAFGDAVNRELDACGFPLCEGGIMAGRPACCLELPAWVARFDDWIARGDPPSLLNAAIFFDFRAIHGRAALADELAAAVREMARTTPRFLKQMSDNALANHPPREFAGGLLEPWLGAARGDIDLKMQGTVPFVDGARVLALAHGIAATGTAQRLERLAARGLVGAAEVRGWVDAFQFLQGLRLRAQQQTGHRGRSANLVSLETLSELDRRVLREAFHQARKLQQRLAIDYP
jgi:CBS domain-containing protein